MRHLLFVCFRRLPLVKASFFVILTVKRDYLIFTSRNLGSISSFILTAWVIFMMGQSLEGSCESSSTVGLHYCPAFVDVYHSCCCGFNTELKARHNRKCSPKPRDFFTEHLQIIAEQLLNIWNHSSCFHCSSSKLDVEWSCVDCDANLASHCR